ncbi:cell division protein FtsQ/DivIB [Patescibacteria group bacterium]
MSIYQYKQKQYSDQTNQQRRPNSFIKIFDFIIIVGIISTIIYFMFFSDVFTINKVKVSGLADSDKKNVQKEIELQVIDKNIFLLKSVKLKIELLEQYSNIKNVYINKNLPSILNVSFEERQNVFCWLYGEDYYLVDNSGIVYEHTQEKCEPILEIDSDGGYVKKPQIKTKYFDAREIDFIKNLNKELSQNKEIEFEKFIFREAAYEIIVNTPNYNIIFNTAREFGEQYKSLNSILPKVKKQVKEYIDLRVPGKVFYR